jgi:hypothetical protein
LNIPFTGLNSNTGGEILLLPDFYAKAQKNWQCPNLNPALNRNPFQADYDYDYELRLGQRQI